MKLELTEEQVKNLLAFLGRVDMKGNEVPVFNDLLNQIHKASQPVPEVKTKK